MAETAGSRQGMSRRGMLLGMTGLGAGIVCARTGLPRVEAATHEQLVAQFAAALTPDQRAQIFLPWEHPSRQLVNTLAIRKSPHLGTLLNAEQMPYAWRLWELMQSPSGVSRFREPLRAEAGGLDGCVLAIYGDPMKGPCQSVISGGHIELRAGAQTNGGFGDGVAYGHQVGNHQLRVPGNVWAHHSDVINALVGTFTPAQLVQAVVAEKPHELVLQVQGQGGRFDGLPVSTFDDRQRAGFCEGLATLLASYAPGYVEQATADLQFLGGIDGLHVALYAENGFYPDGKRYAGGEVLPDQAPYFQVWRVEGPGFVLHFEGFPHVHAYLRIAREPHRQHVGETLAETSRLLEGAPVRHLVEAAMQRETGADVALMPGKLPGRLVPGPITTGTLWTLDPYANTVVVATVRGSQLGSSVRQRLGEGSPDRVYRLATIDYLLDQFPQTFGHPEQTESTGLLLRDVLVSEARRDHLRSLVG